MSPVVLLLAAINGPTHQELNPVYRMLQAMNRRVDGAGIRALIRNNFV